MRVVIGKYQRWLPKARRYIPAQRKVEVRIDPYDTWSLDHTLALIILPALKQLKQQKCGAIFIDDEDVPENLRSTKDTSYVTKENGGVDKFFFDRFEYVINEMIWAFKQIVCDRDGSRYFSSNRRFKDLTIDQRRDCALKFDARIDTGTRLFGKYYRGLWT